VKGQVDDLLEEIRLRAEKNERVLVTTLTKRMAEDLSEYFRELRALPVPALGSGDAGPDQDLRDLRKGGV